MQELFTVILYQPIFNIFVLLYDLVGDVGIVIFIVTLLIKLALYPLTNQSIKAQKSLTDMQPKLEAIKKEHKDNQQMLAQETMKLYKEHKVNPLGSCLPILIQLPIFIALYYVLRDGLGAAPRFDLLYPFVKNPESIDPVTLGLFNLTHPSIILAILAAGAQYWQAQMFSRKRPPAKAGEAAKDESMTAIMNKQMLYVMPLLTLIIGIQFPGGLTLYWLLSTVFTGAQQYFILKKHGDNTPKSDNTIIEGKIVS